MAKAFIFTAVVGGILGSVAVAEEKKEEKGTRNLNDYSCKDVMRLDEDREIAMGVLHGFLLGKKGTTEYQTDKLAEATDKFIEYCLDHPNDKAVDTLSKFVQ